MYALLADVIVTLHFSVVLFMILGFLGICVGWPLGWRWIRNPWFRWPHLGIMAYIVLNALRGELCFLTHWESAARERAGQLQASEVSFIGRLFHELTFVEVSQDWLGRIYYLVGALVLVQCLFIRPRPFRPRNASPSGAGDRAP